MREELRSSDDESGKPAVTIELRVPGPWISPQQLRDALVERKTGYELTADGSLRSPDGDLIEIGTSDHDDEIAQIFRGGHHGRMTEEELVLLGTHAVKVHVVGPGGSVDPARRVVRAAAALVRAGGYGVFVDNSGLCHGPEDFLKLADDEQPGGVFWAFVTATGDPDLVYSCGMHCLGLRDVELYDPPQDQQEAWTALHEFLGYSYQSGTELHDGDHMGGLPDSGVPEYIMRDIPCTRFEPGTPFHNPFGVWELKRAADSEAGEVSEN